MADVLTFQRRARTVICQVCARPFMSSSGPPYLCSSCEAAADAAIDAELEATARAAGFASFEKWADAQYQAAMAEGVP